MKKSTAFFLALAGWKLIDNLRLRAKARALPVLAPTDLPVDPEHTFWTAPGVSLDEATKRSASSYARMKGFDAIDLWPFDFEAEHMIHALRESSTPKTLFAPGTSAGQAVLVTRQLADRASARAFDDPGEFKDWVTQLRHFGVRVDSVIAPTFHASEDVSWQDNRFQRTVAQGPLLTMLVRAAGAFLPVIAPLRSAAGWPLLVITNLTAAIAIAGSPLRPRSLRRSLLLRAPLNAWRFVATLLEPVTRGPDDPAARQEYEAAMAPGWHEFFQPRAEQCPLCGSSDLVPFVQSPDVLQGKPGVFRLERCGACDHVFQNPQLTSAGLDFYYKDAYDGLGEATVEKMFGGSAAPYRTRARRVDGYVAPKAWLDVGAGHGHFPRAARTIWPECQFDVVEMSDAIEDAVQRGWVAHAFRDNFPDIAGQIENKYEVVSMFHYLEHTVDPLSEIRAAHTALKPGGYLLIEVPNPVSTFSRRLGSFWFGWMQPQHLHFFTVENFERLFREAGFEAVDWHWKDAHVSINFLAGTLILLNRLAPALDAPWRPRPSLVDRGVFFLVWGAAPVLLAPAALLDTLLAPFLARPNRSFNYGVLARRI